MGTNTASIVHEEAGRRTSLLRTRTLFLVPSYICVTRPRSHVACERGSTRNEGQDRKERQSKHESQGIHVTDNAALSTSATDCFCASVAIASQAKPTGTQAATGRIRTGTCVDCSTSATFTSACMRFSLESLAALHSNVDSSNHKGMNASPSHPNQDHKPTRRQHLHNSTQQASMLKTRSQGKQAPH